MSTTRPNLDPRRPSRRWTWGGYLLSGLGLGSFSWGVGRVVSSWSGGGSPPSPVLLVSLMLGGLLLGGTGFALLVVGSDPFEEDESNPQTTLPGE